jgi:manganese-dependent inorganic pyrophosphatase
LDTHIYIFGHLTPDTDSICSSICYANLKNKLGYKNATPYRLGKISKETEFILNYFKVQPPEVLTDVSSSTSVKNKVILIDHNERNQSIRSLDSAEIIEIIDHHRFSDIHTNNPLFIRAEPVGCTATIVTKIYKENNIEIDKTTAGLLLSAILSDTLIFTSPTCTPIDKTLGLELAKISNIDYEAFGQEIFIASTNLDDVSAKEILAIDRKKFTFGEYTAFISQVNTMDYTTLHPRKESLLEELQSHATRNNSDLNILMVTDIPLGGSELLAVGTQKEVMTKIFKMPVDENSIYLPDVVSRKKQIVPLL